MAPTPPWGQWGGTSDAAPQWAGLIAIADEGRMLLNEAPLSGASQTLPLLYSLAGSGDFHDITSGTSSSGGRRGTSYSAGPGYDLVTGLGTPHADLIVSALVGGSGTTPAPPPNPTPTQSPTHFSVTTSAGTTVGSAVNVTITALDANNQQVSGYLGTVQLTSSDPLATSGSAANKLPTRYTFVAGDGGSHTFSVTLATTGNQTITATDVATASIVGQATLAVAPAPTTTATTIEDFEGNPTYNVAGFWTGNFTLSTAAAHNGNYGLDVSNGNDWIYRDDAAAQIQQGDSVSVWLKFAGSADGRAYFGFGATAAGTLSLVAAPNSGQLMLQNNPGYGFANSIATSQSWLPNHWYRLEVDWGTSGLLVGKLFDSNGTTLLNSVTAMTSGFTPGGIAFRAIGSDKYFDTVTVMRGVNHFTAPPATSSANAALAALTPPAAVAARYAVYEAYTPEAPCAVSRLVPPGSQTQGGQPSDALQQEWYDLFFNSLGN